MNLEAFDLFGEEIDCSICLEQIKEGQRTVLISLCQHGFHQSCLDPWLLTHSTCPNCRGTIHRERDTLSNRNELDRLYLTYVLFSWILQTFSGVRFQRHYIAIHSFVSQIEWSSLRPIAFNMTTRNRTSLTAIRALRGYCISRETTLFEQTYPSLAHRVIHRNPRVIQIRDEIQSQLNAFAQRLS